MSIRTQTAEKNERKENMRKKESKEVNLAMK